MEKVIDIFLMELFNIWVLLSKLVQIKESLHLKTLNHDF